VPIETLAEEGMPDALSGAEGHNRGAARQATINAANDVAAVLAWLDAQAESAHTRRAYRTQAERIVLWAIVERGKPLSSLDAHDICAYRRFMASPPSSWVAPRHTPRWSVRWRPFAGPLTESSRATASNVLKALFRWLVTVGYLATDPWRASQNIAADLPLEEGAPTALPKTVDARQSDGFDTRMRLRVERQVGALQWQAVTHFATQSDSERDLRAFCMLALSRAAGLRLHELAALQLCDVALPSSASTSTSASGTVRVVSDVGGDAKDRPSAARKVDIPAWTVAALRRYLDARGVALGRHLQTDQRPLFVPIRDEVREGNAAPKQGVEAVVEGATMPNALTLTAPSTQAGPPDSRRVQRRMHPTALARTIGAFLDRVAESAASADAVFAASLRQLRSGDCRHSFLRSALLSATPLAQLQATLGLRSRTSINAHRRAMVASNA